MGCIPFCLCTKKFSPKVFAIIAIVCNGLKIIMNFLVVFIVLWSVLVFANILSIFEIIFTITNLVNAIIILVKITNKDAFGISNKNVKVLCIISMILIGIIIAFKLLALFLLIFAASKGMGFWIPIIITYIFYIAFELINFLAFNYLYRLLNLKADCSYEEYLKNGSPIEQNSVTQTNIQVVQNNKPVLPINFPNTFQQNTDSNINVNVKV